jgi:hypothetical protein
MEVMHVSETSLHLHWTSFHHVPRDTPFIVATVFTGGQAKLVCSVVPIYTGEIVCSHDAVLVLEFV